MTGRKLGRGLDVLIGRKSVRTDAEVSRLVSSDDHRTPGSEGENPGSLEVIEIDPKTVDANPKQPRKSFSENELEMLKASISQEGLLQPVLVRKVGESYQLIVGERRLRAARELDLQRIPAIVMEVDDDRLLEVALIENIQRQDLNPIEIARAYRQLVDSKGWTQEALARSLGISRSSVTNSLRLLELPQDVQTALVRRHITPGHAKVLLSVEDDEDRRQLFDRIAEDRLSVRELEEARQGEGQLEPPPERAPQPQRGPPPKKKPRLAGLEEELSRALGTRVSIVEAGGKKNKGKICIEFYSSDDFERLHGLLLRQ